MCVDMLRIASSSCAHEEEGVENVMRVSTPGEHVMRAKGQPNNNKHRRPDLAATGHRNMF